MHIFFDPFDSAPFGEPRNRMPGAATIYLLFLAIVPNAASADLFLLCKLKSCSIVRESEFVWAGASLRALISVPGANLYHVGVQPVDDALDLSLLILSIAESHTSERDSGV